MKRRLSLLALLAIVGVVGIILGSVQLSMFFVFAVMPLVLLLKDEEKLKKSTKASIKNTLVISIFAYTTVFLLAAILSKVPMIIQQCPFDVLLLIFVEALSACFAITLVAFVAQIFIFYAWQSRKEKQSQITEQED